MKSKTIKKLYTLHSWVGVITGILLFVIAFTGAVSVFGRPELKLWANPEIRALPVVDTYKVEQLVKQYSAQVPEHYKEEVMIFLPGSRGFKNLVIIFESHHGELVQEDDGGAAQTHNNPPVGTLFEFDPHSYQLVKQQSDLIENIFAGRQTDMADFIVDFHADLHLGRPIGLLTTGILGLTMMLSIVTGIFIHRKILKHLFTFRPRKSYSLMLNDGHKAIGVWGLLFNSVIAFTGAFLGLAIVVLVPAAAFVSFGGDQDKLIETFTAVADPVIQHIQQPTAIANAFNHAFTIDQDAYVNAMTVKGYNDASAMIYVGLSGGHSMAAQTAVYQGNGSFVEVYSNFARLDGVSGVILDIMFPLHFGNFGGILVKLIWAVLGMGTAMLPLTGLMLWMERGVNAAKPKYSLRTYQRFNRLIVGACGGIVVATLVLFPAQVVIKYLLPVDNVGAVIGWPFFLSWLLVLVLAFLLPCEKKLAKQITLFCAVLLLAVLPLDLAVSATGLLNQLMAGHYVSLGIDFACLALAIYLFHMLKKLNKSDFVGTAPAVQSAAVKEGA